MALPGPPAVRFSFLGSADETEAHRAGAWDGVGGDEAITMSDYMTTGARRRLVVDVHLLLARNGRVLLSQRANTGYGDGAYEPPSSQLSDRETIVETAIRIAEAIGITIGADEVTLAHVMHDVSGGGRIAFFLAVPGWEGDPAAAEVRWFPLDALPTNMLDRARVALRNYVEDMRFSTYPSFAPPAHLAS